MKVFLICGLLVLASTGLGAGLGWYLRPIPTAEEADPTPLEPTASAFVKLPAPFVIPIIEQGRIDSVMVINLSLEVSPQTESAVMTREPRIRDELLRVLFDHTNSGGFRGTFTDSSKLLPLRRALREAAQGVLDDIPLRDVLITEIIRQDA